ncbi:MULTISPECIES: energy-coupled thiamine transporter ThiT [Lacticaseibacillus]|uniref:Energy-coupled thiamine transporter ThiT n=2 Tax=Lacticaseibacillus TaxID=2759736 RepID=A0ABW4CMU6_9LACO|nr:MULTISPECIES: energy-coupled thiamine transporter ThiT [Lacticaseibacillus]
MDKRKEDLVILVEVAVIAALAMALEYIPHQLGVSSIQISYGVVPLVVLALRRGVWPGLSAGLVWGLLDLFLKGLADGEVLNLTQGLLEYPVAFTVVGFAGLMMPAFQKALRDGRQTVATVYALAAIAIGAGLKYFAHFVAGVIFWGSYAPKGIGAWMWSLIVNGGSFVVSTALAIVVIGALIVMAKQLFLPKTTQSLGSVHN